LLATGVESEAGIWFCKSAMGGKILRQHSVDNFQVSDLGRAKRDHDEATHNKRQCQEGHRKG